MDTTKASARESFKGEEELESSAPPAVPHLFRLFVGWVPKFFTEEQLKPIFDQCGVVRDLIVLKDKVTSQPRGCAFVSYATKEEAEAAIAKLDRQIHLPGALCPLEVRFARSHQYIQAGSGPEDNRQLFFSRAPTSASEEDIATVFGTFGPVEEVNLFRDRRTGLSKGCGFISMQAREHALAAMESLDERHTMEGASQTLQVKWADPELQLKKKKALEDSNADNRMLFFAKVLRSATEDAVKVLFSRFGKVYDVNLFRAFQGAPTTKGCGLVTMGSHAEAVAAIDALDNKYIWEGMESPMVVKWMDAALQRRRREQHLAALRQGLVPTKGAADAWLPGGVSLPGAARPGLPAALLGTDIDPLESPPAGCAPDAIKLFVGNIPKSCTEDQLMPFFETIGKVVELVIVRDKSTHESKGSAFVWYGTRAQAERAILQFNLRHVLPDPSGEQDRPLVVRKAKSKSKNMQPTMPMLAQPQAVQLGQYYPKVQQGMLPVHSLEPVQLQGPLVGVQAYRNIGHVTTMGLQPIGGAQLVGIQGAPAVQEAGLYEAYGGTSADQALMEQFVQVQAGPSNTMDSLSQLAVSIPLNQNQLATVNQHLYSVQAMSGAQLHVSPGAPGLFHLVISGVKQQVETARNLLTSVLGQMV